MQALILFVVLTSARLACENCMKAELAPLGASLSFLALFFGGGFDEPLPEGAFGR